MTKLMQMTIWRDYVKQVDTPEGMQYEISLPLEEVDVMVEALMKTRVESLTSLKKKIKKLKVPHADCCFISQNGGIWCNCGTTYINGTLDKVLSLLPKPQAKENQ